MATPNPYDLGAHQRVNTEYHDNNREYHDDVHNDVSDTDYPASFSSDYDTENDHYNHNSSTLPYR